MLDLMQAIHHCMAFGAHLNVSITQFFFQRAAHSNAKSIPGIHMLFTNVPGRLIGASNMSTVICFSGLRNPTRCPASCVLPFPMQASSASLQTQSSALLDILSSEVGEQCCGVVKALKAIAATYRMTTKGPPVRHSHYAAGVLAPLATLLASPQVGSNMVSVPRFRV